MDFSEFLSYLAGGVAVVHHQFVFALGLAEVHVNEDQRLLLVRGFLSGYKFVNGNGRVTEFLGDFDGGGFGADGALAHHGHAFEVVKAGHARLDFQHGEVGELLL